MYGYEPTYLLSITAHLAILPFGTTDSNEILGQLVVGGGGQFIVDTW